ncbi:MAG TPA: SDR family oxidoreductase [Acidimicrobiales bacterium]
MDLTGHVVIVTGSTSGIGEAIVRRLAGHGARLVVNSASSVSAGEQLVSELAHACYVQGDISDPDTAQALVDAARGHWGRLDGLVNNAAVTVDVAIPDIDDVTAEHWTRVLGVNVIGTFLVSQAALPLLRSAEDGWIINITSIAGIRQTGSSLPYAVSKAAVDHLTKLLAKHAGGHVRVNAVAPGLVATPWTATWDELKAGVSAMAPLERVATPEDIADACVAVIQTRYMTGQTMLVDGGLALML